MLGWPCPARRPALGLRVPGGHGAFDHARLAGAITMIKSEMRLLLPAQHHKCRSDLPADLGTQLGTFWGGTFRWREAGSLPLNLQKLAEK